jgi:hypothetical protein
VTVGSINAQQKSSLWQGAGLGGLIGMFLGQPILGALGGLAYKLFSTEGLADSAGKILGDAAGGDPLAAFGKWFGGSPAAEKADTGATAGTTAEPKAAPEQKSGGLPGWVKALGIGVAGLTALNFVQDNVGSTFMGMPYGMGMGGMGGFGGFGGFGMPFLGQPYYGGFGFGYPFF